MFWYILMTDLRMTELQGCTYLKAFIFVKILSIIPKREVFTR